MVNILLAEDDITLRQFLTAALEKAGHAVTPCSDGLSALDAAQSLEPGAEAYDLLLTDIVMPGIDGIELSQRVSEIFADIRVVFITGFSGVALDATHKEQAHTKLLSKPFHLNDLVQQIETVLSH